MPAGNKKVLSIRLYDIDRAKLEFIKGYHKLNASDALSMLIEKEDKRIMQTPRPSNGNKKGRK